MQDSGHGKLVQLVFVIHMQYMTKFYCSVSFACQYIRVLSDIFFYFSEVTLLTSVCLLNLLFYTVFESGPEVIKL